jgi:hypothetical protein
MPRKQPESINRYYKWGSEACRVYDDGTGNETADFYTSDMGFVPVDVAVLIDQASLISREEYDDLVRAAPERIERVRTLSLTEPDSPIVETTYFRWDGDACRLHKHKNGRMTADLYRGGVGFVPISPFERDWSVPICEEDYKDLVEEEDEVRKTD